MTILRADRLLSALLLLGLAPALLASATGDAVTFLEASAHLRAVAHVSACA